jgi:hypothetical protein
MFGLDSMALVASGKSMGTSEKELRGGVAERPFFMDSPNLMNADQATSNGNPGQSLHS